MHRTVHPDSLTTHVCRALLGAFCGTFFGMCLPLWAIEREQYVFSTLSFGGPTEEEMIAGLWPFAAIGAAVEAILAVRIGRRRLSRAPARAATAAMPRIDPAIRWNGGDALLGACVGVLTSLAFGVCAWFLAPTAMFVVLLCTVVGGFYRLHWLRH